MVPVWTLTLPATPSTPKKPSTVFAPQTRPLSASLVLTFSKTYASRTIARPLCPTKSAPPAQTMPSKSPQRGSVRKSTAESNRPLLLSCAGPMRYIASKMPGNECFDSEVYKVLRRIFSRSKRRSMPLSLPSRKVLRQQRLLPAYTPLSQSQQRPPLLEMRGRVQNHSGRMHSLQRTKPTISLCLLSARPLRQLSRSVPESR